MASIMASKLTRTLIVIGPLLAATSFTAPPARADRLVLKTATGLSFVSPDELNAEYRAINEFVGGMDASGYRLPQIKNLLNQLLYAGWELNSRLDLGVLFTVPIISTISTEGTHPTTGRVTTEIHGPHLNLALGGHYNFLPYDAVQVYLHPFAGVTFWRADSDANIPFRNQDGLESVNLAVSTRGHTFFGGATVGALYNIDATFRINLEAGYHHWQTPGLSITKSNDPNQRVGDVQTFPLTGGGPGVTNFSGFIVALGLSAAFDLLGGAPEPHTRTEISSTR